MDNATQPTIYNGPTDRFHIRHVKSDKSRHMYYLTIKGRTDNPYDNRFEQDLYPFLNRHDGYIWADDKTHYNPCNYVKHLLFDFTGQIADIEALVQQWRVKYTEIKG